MTATPPTSDDRRAPSPEAPASLRLRLWVGCLGGALVTGAGVWWVIGSFVGPGEGTDLALVVSWLAAVAALGVVVGAAFALWLDHGIIGHLRGLTHGVATGRVSDLRGLPGSAGWGELSQLTEQLQLLLTHHRQALRAAEELGLVRHQIARLRESLEGWAQSERWSEPPLEPGPLAPIAETLDRGLRRLEEVREQNLEAARQVRAEVDHALDEAREAAEQAERGFVEATALLTTVRELQRLGGELDQSVAGADLATETTERLAEGAAAYRALARGAIEDLVASSSDSVEHLARGLARVQEVADQVQLLANRATLIALNAALGTTRGEGAALERTDLAEEMRRLASEVRAATDHTRALSLEVEAEVASAIQRMRAVRERVGERLEQAPVWPEPTGGAREDAGHLVSRVREMIQDATQKGERLSAAGERVSRAAERVLRRLEDEVAELAGLMVRLAPPGPIPDPEPLPRTAPSALAPERAPEAAPRTGGLRLLGHDDLLPDEGARGDEGERGARGGRVEERP
jgi:methyl-accepting chemotaxis protein